MTTPPETFADIGAAAAPVFSRDGRTLFHLRGAGLSQIWALDVDTGRERQLTFHDERVAMIRRSPQDDRIVYGIDRGGDERQQLLLLDPRAADPSVVPLTANHAVIHDWGGWSPDATRIAYAANERDAAHFDVFVQEIATRVRSCVFEGSGIVGVAGFRADGAKLALVQDRGHGNMSLLVLDIAGGEIAAFPEPSGTNYLSVRWSNDGRTLLALTDHGGADKARLCRLDPDAHVLTVVYAAPGREVEAWAVSSDGHLLATIENDRGYGILRVGPMDGDRPVVQGLPRGVIGDLAFSPDGKKLAFTVATPTTPPAIWMWQGGVVNLVWQPECPIESGRLADATLVEWVSFDGMRIPGWLMLPPGPVPPDGHKSIVWVHGGPVGQARPNFRPDLQMLVAQGYAVLVPNVRGSAGYGRAYAAADDLGKRLDCVADLAHGRHWLASHPAIDSDRIAVMGQSYGGYMVNAAITEHAELWKAAVSYYSIVDFVTTLEGTGPWRRSHRAAEYGDPDRDKALFARISPIHHVDRVRVPVLLAHGTRDPRVPYGESVQFEAALRARGKRVEFLTFDYAGHGFIRPDDKRRIYRAVADFFARTL